MYTNNNLIGNLQNLVLLNLSDNFLEEIPAEIGQLKRLTKLYIDHNEILELCNEIGNLISLRVKLDI